MPTTAGQRLGASRPPLRRAALRAASALATLGTVLGVGMSAAPEAAAATSAQSFVASIAPAAVATQQRTGVPASVTIAHAIVESGWGRSGLTRSARNYFGIKCGTPRGTYHTGCVALPTREYVRGRAVVMVERFRYYPSTQASFEDHARLLSTRYSAAMAHRDDPEAFVRNLRGYATDPAYASMLIRVMRAYDLTRYDRRVAAPAPRPAASTTAYAIPAAARRWIVDRRAPAARVAVLQRALRAQGFRVEVDGRWGPATVAALTWFQRSHGVRADGVAGPKTWAHF